MTSSVVAEDQRGLTKNRTTISRRTCGVLRGKGHGGAPVSRAQYSVALRMM